MPYGGSASLRFTPSGVTVLWANPNAGFDVEGGFVNLIPYRNNPAILLVVAALIALLSLSAACTQDRTQARSAAVTRRLAAAARSARTSWPKTTSAPDMRIQARVSALPCTMNWPLTTSSAEHAGLCDGWHSLKPRYRVLPERTASVTKSLVLRRRTLRGARPGRRPHPRER